MKTSCARIAGVVIDVLKFRAGILYVVCHEMRRNYKALVTAGAQSTGIDDAAITREEKQVSRQGADDQCGAVIAYWATYYLSRNWQCSLCGTSGVVDTRGRALNGSGQDQGALQFCFCPAGQKWREMADPSNPGAIIETLHSYYTGDEAFKAQFNQFVRERARRLKDAGIRERN
ncbi:MAG: hypothetical protein MOB07_25740 [Acidobacteria bacterium]|nr:hypothetical protein [Acidobacteriota bacterium]